MADWYFRNPQRNGGGLKSCPGCRNLVRFDEEFCPYCAQRLRAPGGVRGLVKRLENVPFLATKTLIGLIGLFFLLQMVSDLFLPGKTPDGGLFMILVSKPETYVRMGSNFHPYVQLFGECWRFLTYCFLHFGLIHIVFNCWAFWDLGRLAEQFWGPRQVFATFILTGIVGGAASYGCDYIWNYPEIGYSNSAGASGAICGVLGLLIGAYYRNKFHIGEYLGPRLIQWAALILVMGLVGRFDNAAHVGGLISGGLLGYFLVPSRFSRNIGRDTKIWNAAAIVSVLLFLVCYGFAAVFYFTAVLV